MIPCRYIEVQRAGIFLADRDKYRETRWPVVRLSAACGCSLQSALRSLGSHGRISKYQPGSTRFPRRSDDCPTGLVCMAALCDRSKGYKGEEDLDHLIEW